MIDLNIIYIKIACFIFIYNICKLQHCYISWTCDVFVLFQCGEACKIWFRHDLCWSECFLCVWCGGIHHMSCLLHKVVRCGVWFARIDQGSVVLVGRNALGRRWAAKEESRESERGLWLGERHGRWSWWVGDLESVMGDKFDKLLEKVEKENGKP